MQLFLRLTGLICLYLALTAQSCNSEAPPPPISNSGVRQAQTTVATDQNGHSTEQKNIMERLQRDNNPGAMKHLYVVSAYSGDVLLYSTVRGKVTSSGKRLSPTTVAASHSDYYGGIPINAGGYKGLRTGEVVQDDGTYGTSEPYIYWFTPNGNYYQLYLQGGMFVVISDRALTFPKIVVNIAKLEESGAHMSGTVTVPPQSQRPPDSSDVAPPQ